MKKIVSYLTDCYGTVIYSLMDSSKSYINREASTLVGRSVGRREIGQSLDIRLTTEPSLRHHFSLYLVTSIYP